MAPKQFTMATLAGAVVLFFLGFLVYGVVLMDFFASNVGTATGVAREVPLWWALIVGQVMTVALLVMVMGWRGDSSAGAGLKTGALMGLIWALGVDFTFLGVTNMSNLTATLVDPIVFMIQLGITGSVVGAVLGMGSGSTEEAPAAAAPAPPPPTPPAPPPSAIEHTGEQSAGM